MINLRLLTIAEYVGLGETEHGYTELQEGLVLTCPNPGPEHNIAASELADALDRQGLTDLAVILRVDIDLELVPDDRPGFSRRPDLVVVERAAVDRVRACGGLLRASEVRLVVEIVSPGSKRMDNVIKLGEYADAGIPHYWIVDLEPPVSMQVWHLVDEFGYQDSGTFTGEISLLDPFTIDLDLHRLC